MRNKTDVGKDAAYFHFRAQRVGVVGAVGTIARNVFVQGASKENYSAFITVAPEGKTRSSTGLSITNNDASIAAGVDRNTVFLADWSGDRISLGANRLGRGVKPFERR